MGIPGKIEKMSRRLSRPTGPLTMLKPQHQEISEFYVVLGRRATDFQATKLRKGQSGEEEEKEED